MYIYLHTTSFEDTHKGILVSVPASQTSLKPESKPTANMLNANAVTAVVVSLKKTNGG